MAIDPVTAGLILKGIGTGLSFYSSNKQAKQSLQELHQNRLLAQLRAVSNTNDIMTMTTEMLRDNETMASTAGYYANDSASFRAIQARVSENEARDLANVDMQKNIAVDSINQSISNLKTQMTLDRIQLAVDAGSMWYSHSNYMKDKNLEKIYRKKEKVYQENILKNQKNTLDAIRKQNKLLNKTFALNDWNRKKLLRRTYGNIKFEKKVRY